MESAQRARAGVAADAGAESAKKEAEERRKLDEEIANNIQQRQLEAASLQDRIAMLDTLIAKETAYTDEWVRLTTAHAPAFMSRPPGRTDG